MQIESTKIEMFSRILLEKALLFSETIPENKLVLSKTQQKLTFQKVGQESR